MWFEGRYQVVSRDVSQARCIKVNWDFGLLVCFFLEIKITIINKENLLDNIIISYTGYLNINSVIYICGDICM
jgi:hypothetical protein